MAFSTRTISDRPASKTDWVVPITAMTFVLGLLISLAVRTEITVRPGQNPNVAFDGGTYQSMRETINDLKAQNLALQQANFDLTNNHSIRPELRQELDQAQMLAGLVAVHGPGVIVTLNDSKKRPPSDIPSSMVDQLTSQYIVHDVDLQRVVNELRAGGAENIAINDERVVGSTAIRCVGPAIQVNGDPLTPPYAVEAIGNPQQLTTTMQLPGGIQETLDQTDPAMIGVSKANDITLPAFDGDIKYKFSKPVTPDGRTRASKRGVG